MSMPNEKKYRKYEIIIESTECEKINLQQFLIECHRLAVTLFPSLPSCNRIKNEACIECCASE